jgi:hypothetical protein
MNALLLQLLGHGLLEVSMSGAAPGSAVEKNCEALTWPQPSSLRMPGLARSLHIHQTLYLGFPPLQYISLEDVGSWAS